MKIEAVHKDNGTITQYRLDNGQVVDKPQCIQMVKDGQIDNCNVGVNRDNEEFVRTDRDTEDGFKQITNLDDLPTF